MKTNLYTKLKYIKKKSDNELLYNVEIPEINLAEPLYNLVEYIAKSLKKKSNDIFKNNLNYKITKLLEKI